MAFTKVLGPGIHTLANVTSHNINSSGIITATKFVGDMEPGGGTGTFDSLTVTGNLGVGGTLTYMDVTNVDAVGIITAQEGIHFGIGATAGKFEAATGITTLSSLKVSNLTSGRVTYAGSGGELTDSANLTFSGSNLGIGTVIPQTRFEVSDATGTRIRARHTNVGGGRDAGFDIWSDDSGTFAARASLVHSGSIGRTTLYAQNKFNIHSDQTDTSLYIARNGSIGIGTETLATKLHLQDGDFTIKSSGECGPYLYRSGGNGPDLVFHSGRGLSLDSPTASGGTDLLGNINFAGHDGSGWHRRATINGVIDGTVSTNTVPTAIMFRTGTTSAIERLRITSTGALEGQTAYAAVGINTFAKFTRTGGGGPHLEIGYNAVTTDYGYFGTGSAHDLGLRTNDVTRLRIGSGGGVGISTTLIRNQYFLNIAAASQDYSSGSTNLTDGGGIMFQPTDTLPSTNRTYPGIFWSGNTASLGRSRAGIVGVTAANNDATDIAFLTRYAADGTAFYPTDERVRITSAGNFLVGKNSVYGSAIAQVHNTSQYVLDLNLWAASADPAVLAFYKSRNATPGSATVVQDDDGIGSLRFLGNDGANSREAAYIKAYVDGSPGTNDMPGRLIFGTTHDGGSSSTERLRIQSNGNVGIARTLNSYQLDTSNTPSQHGCDSEYNLSINREAHNTTTASRLGFNKTLNVDNQYAVSTFRAENVNRNGTQAYFDIAKFVAWDINAKVTIQAGGTFTGDQVEIRVISSYNSALNNSRSGPYLEVKSTQAHTARRFTKVKLGTDNNNRHPILQVYLDGNATHNALGTITVTVHDYGSNYGGYADRGEAKFATATTLNETWKELEIYDTERDRGTLISEPQGMVLDSPYVTKPAQVAFSMHSSLGSTNLTENTKIAFNQAGTGFGNTLNTARNHSSINTTDHSFTAPVTGLYLTVVTLFLYNDNMSNICSIVPRINDSQLSNGSDTIFYFAVQGGTGAQEETHSGTLLLQLNKGEVLTVHARGGNVGTHKYYGAHSHFQGVLIG